MFLCYSSHPSAGDEESKKDQKMKRNKKKEEDQASDGMISFYSLRTKQSNQISLSCLSCLFIIHLIQSTSAKPLTANNQLNSCFWLFLPTLYLC